MKTEHNDWELIRESRWMRVYKTGPKDYRYQSKFITDHLMVPLDELKDNWSRMVEQDQLDFAQALACKAEFSTEDQDILGFLIETGPEFVWFTIAIRLPEYWDKEKSLAFLLERIAQRPPNSGNYYQALEILGDARAVSLLQGRYNEYRNTLRPRQELSINELGEYILCCSALRKLDSSPEYNAALGELLEHPDPAVRHWVANALS
jgi:hypothetical protein